MKPKYEPKVGDVVRLVGYGCSDQYPVCVEGEKAEVVQLTPKGDTIFIKLADADDKIEVYPSQCRKIVVKKRRTLWIRGSDIPGPERLAGVASIASNQPISKKYIEFVEVRKRK